MRHGAILPATLPWLVLLSLQGCDKPTTPSRIDEHSGSPTADAEMRAAEADDADLTEPSTPFDEAQVFFEFNSTDKDLGLQVFLDAEDWKRLRVLDPGRNEIVLLQAAGKLARLGITELRFESAEPSPDEVLALFPPGEYRFRGRTVEGELLRSTATLSHHFPPAPIFSPSGGAVVDRREAIVEWKAPEAEQVEIIIEQDELEHVLDVTLSGSTRRLKIPPQFLTPGEEYKIEILSISENGNRTIAESTFEVAD